MNSVFIVLKAITSYMLECSI